MSPWTDALLVEDGRIAAVGAAGRRGGEARERDDTVELPGALVIPGLHDAHIHTEWLSATLSSVDLREARSLEETLELARAHVGATARRASGCTADAGTTTDWDGPGAARPACPRLGVRRPGRRAVERRRPHGLGQLRCPAPRRHHPRDPDPVGGEIARDASGEPTGILRESAQDLLDVDPA